MLACQRPLDNRLLTGTKFRKSKNVLQDLVRAQHAVNFWRNAPVGLWLQLSSTSHIRSFFGHQVEPMAKRTFYFVLAILVVVDVVQGRYQKKLLAQRATKIKS